MADMTNKIRSSPELAAIVERWIKAYGRGDGETVGHLFSDDAALSYFGSAQGESWRGDALRRGMEQYIGEVPRFEWNPQELRGFECGSLGWVEWEATIDGIETGQSAQLRSTVILNLDKGSWKIVHVHNSIPVNNVEGFGYEARGFEELLDAALSTPYELGQSGIATVMFTDIADSTTIAEAIGDTLWTDAVHKHLRLVEHQIVESGGQMVKSLGDGMMSSFASARAALLAAKNIQQKNAAQTAEPKLQVRIGLHTGEVITSDADHFGTVVNKAARIAALAAPSDICVSDATRIMVGGSTEFHFGDQMTVPLKGLDGEHSIFKLDWRDGA